MLNEFGFSGDTTWPKVEPFICCRRLHLMDRNGQHILTLMPDNIGAEQVAFTLNALVEQKNVKMSAQVFVLEDDQVIGHIVIDGESGKSYLA